MLAVILVIGAGVAGFLTWYRRTYHEWPGANLPDRLSRCDRTYGRGRTVAADLAPHLTFQYRFEPILAAHHAVYADDARFTNDQGRRCPMALYVKDGRSYVAYGLFGGP